MSQLKSKSQPRRLERVQPGRREEGRLRPRNARVSGEEAVAESDVVNESNNGVGDGLRAEQQDLRNSSPAALLGDRPAEDTIPRERYEGEVRKAQREQPLGWTTKRYLCRRSVRAAGSAEARMLRAEPRPGGCSAARAGVNTRWPSFPGPHPRPPRISLSTSVP